MGKKENISSPIKYERIESEAKDMLSPWLNIPLKTQGEALKNIKGNKSGKSGEGNGRVQAFIRFAHFTLPSSISPFGRTRDY